MVPKLVRPCLLSFRYINYRSKQYPIYSSSDQNTEIEKRSDCCSHMHFPTHFFQAFMVDLSLCRYLSLSLSGRYLGAFFRGQRNKSLVFDFSCFLQVQVPLAFPVCCTALLYLWCRQLGWSVPSLIQWLRLRHRETELSSSPSQWLTIHKFLCLGFLWCTVSVQSGQTIVFSIRMMPFWLYQFPNPVKPSALLGPLNINKTNSVLSALKISDEGRSITRKN